MAYLDGWQPLEGDFDAYTVNETREDLRAYFWRWFDRHAEDEIFRVSVVIYKWTFKVKDLDWLFIELFGNHP